jgi:hypothetical protein
MSKWRDDVEILLADLIEHETRLAKINQQAENRWNKLINALEAKEAQT